jgi:hypothetical protein
MTFRAPHKAHSTKGFAPNQRFGAKVTSITHFSFDRRLNER